MAPTKLARPTPQRRIERPHIRGWLASAGFALLIWFVPIPPWVVDEFYSRDFYHWLQGWLTATSNVVPFAVLDALIVAVIVLLVTRLFLLGLATWRWGFRPALLESIRRLVRAVAVIVILFVSMWGCNYRRIPLADGLPGGAATPTVEMLRQAVVDSGRLAARLRSANADTAALEYESLAVSLRSPMNTTLIELNRSTLARPGRPKVSVLLTPFFTLAGVNGMVDPFALESIVHPDLMPYERPFVLAHEWAHLAGHADEAEASAIGWLACMNAGPQSAYSASLYLILEAGGSLPAETRRTVFAALDAGVRADIAGIARRMQQQKPSVERAASQVYDQYLKANRVEDGKASYNRALSLILSPSLHQALRQYRNRSPAR